MTTQILYPIGKQNKKFNSSRWTCFRQRDIPSLCEECLLLAKNFQGTKFNFLVKTDLDNGLTLLWYWPWLQDNEEPYIPIIYKRKEVIDNEQWVISYIIIFYFLYYHFYSMCLCLVPNRGPTILYTLKKYWGI